MQIRRGLLATVAAAALTVSLGASAQAASPFDKQTLTPTSSVKTVTNAECVDAVSAAIAAGATDLSTDQCTRTSTLKVSGARTVTAAELASVKDQFTAAEYSELSAAVINGVLRSKNYSQQMNNITDSQTQYGKFYYDGDAAWVTNTRRGVAGTHHCRIDWAAGIGVDLQACGESGSTYTRNIYMTWKYGFAPAQWSETHTMYVNGVGSIWQ